MDLGHVETGLGEHVEVLAEETVRRLGRPAWLAEFVSFGTTAGKATMMMRCAARPLAASLPVPSPRCMQVIQTMHSFGGGPSYH